MKSEHQKQLSTSPVFNTYPTSQASHLTLPHSFKKTTTIVNLTHLQQKNTTANHVLHPRPRLPPPLPHLRQAHPPSLIPSSDSKPLRPRRRPLHQPHPPANRQRQRPTLLDRQGRRHLLPDLRLPARHVDRTGGQRWSRVNGTSHTCSFLYNHFFKETTILTKTPNTERRGPRRPTSPRPPDGPTLLHPSPLRRHVQRHPLPLRLQRPLGPLIRLPRHLHLQR